MEETTLKSQHTQKLPQKHVAGQTERRKQMEVMAVPWIHVGLEQNPRMGLERKEVPRFLPRL